MNLEKYNQIPTQEQGGKDVVNRAYEAKTSPEAQKTRQIIEGMKLIKQTPNIGLRAVETMIIEIKSALSLKKNGYAINLLEALANNKEAKFMEELRARVVDASMNGTEKDMDKLRDEMINEFEKQAKHTQ